MKNKIISIIEESIALKNLVKQKLADQIALVSSTLCSSIKSGNKIYICGNGGSAADAQHFAAELIVRYKNERKSIPCIGLTTDTSIITACANDYSYDQIFSRQIEGLGSSGDLLIGISTSGNSQNIIEAFKSAKDKEMVTVCLTGNDGGKVKLMGLDHTIVVPSNSTARIQEVHELILHAWCEIIDVEFTEKIN